MTANNSDDHSMSGRFSEISVYETATRYYLVGTTSDHAKYSLMKIDRTESTELVLSDGGHEYSKMEMRELLSMVSLGSQSDAKDQQSTSMFKFKAMGLLGFIRFLEGYYLVLITKASPAAQLGYHTIYKIDDICMLYIPNDATISSNSKSGSSATINGAPPSSKISQVDEGRYLRLFQLLDLTTNFYFSYTYDITRTLQENVVGKNMWCEERYVWNSHLLSPLFEHGSATRWMTPIVHGYIGFRSLNVHGSIYTIMLIARRSCHYAGTRFLKRGSSFEGYVANEVETEQIVFEEGVASFRRGLYTAFVQHRGSVPLVWSQDTTKAVAKPPIQLDIPDPYASIPALHFADMQRKYGAPIIVVNLVKRREHRRQESILGEALRHALSYLNQFLEPEEMLLYIGFDMSRCNKTVGNVIEKLEEIGQHAVERNGWFQTFRVPYCHLIRPHERVRGVRDYLLDGDGGMLLQRGLPRTNCVDCLDRTNTAQFVIGKVALGYQLYAMGVTATPVLDFGTETCRLFEQLFEEQGHALAMQYAGSQLVHSVKTYKKVRPLFQERSRDVIQTLSRYYSSTFNASDKQHALNLFLGVFRPSKRGPHLWDLLGDLYLHNPTFHAGANANYCSWLERERAPGIVLRIHSTRNAVEEDYMAHYRPWELTSFDSVFNRTNKAIPVSSLTMKSQTPVSFLNRLWSGVSSRSNNALSVDTLAEGVGSEKVNNVQSSSEDDSPNVSDADYIEGGVAKASPRAVELDLKCPVPVTFSSRMPSMENFYGTGIRQPSDKDSAVYARFAQMTERPLIDYDHVREHSSGHEKWAQLRINPSSVLPKIEPVAKYTIDPIWVPKVSPEAMAIYVACVACAEHGPCTPNPIARRSYEDYAKVSCM